jgi:death-on-curing protein
MRFDEVLFLEIEDVELVHVRMIAEYGGADGQRDAGLLESAVMAPRSGCYSTLAEPAAAYAIGIALNHAFIDGNKRAALASWHVLLNAHGFDLVLGMEWVARIEQLAAGNVTRDEVVAYFTEVMGGDPVALE